MSSKCVSKGPDLQIWESVVEGRTVREFRVAEKSVRFHCPDQKAGDVVEDVYEGEFCHGTCPTRPAGGHQVWQGTSVALVYLAKVGTDISAHRTLDVSGFRALKRCL